MTNQQMLQWARVSVQLSLSRDEHGLTLEQLASAISDNMDVPETRRLIHFLEAEISKKLDSDVTIQ